MFKGISVLIYGLSLGLLLSNCSAGQLNNVSDIPENLRDATINLSQVDAKDIDEVQVDGKNLQKDDYSWTENKLNLEKLEPGKHVVQFKHKKYGYTDVPIEIRGNQENNFQLNASITNDQLNNWELGIDANQDGVIDNNSFLSRPVEDYVVVREFSGTTNYLPKQNFAQEYRGKKSFPKPDGMKFPGLNPDNREQKPVFLPKGPNPRAGILKIDPAFGMGEPKPPMVNFSRVHIPFPQTVNSFKIVAIFIDDRLLPEFDYTREETSLIFNGGIFKGINNLLKVYLIDETGQGVLLSIHSKQPVFNIDSKGPQLNKEIFVAAEDLDYSIENNIKVDLQKIEQLKMDIKPSGEMPFPQGGNQHRPPPGKVIPVPYSEMGNNPAREATAKKYIKIDENGEIIGLIDQLPPENVQDVSLTDDLK